MSGQLLQRLRQWRDKEAKRRGVEDYRVLQNRSLEEIAEKKPNTKEELLAIYGIAETKCDKYGDTLIDLVSEDKQENENKNDAVPVSVYLTDINDQLSGCSARVRGEVVEYNIRENYLFFTIKDAEAEAAMQCFMWRREYDVSDVNLEDGLEIAVSGVPEIYKPNGRFTFRASTLELVGEGALKKAYEKLKTKLQEAGLFDDDAKLDLPPFPQQVGLITSRESDAYHDFLANLGSFGFSVKFYPSRVQGAKAVPDLIEALDYFAENKSTIQALVITRGGGGNLEVLQAFNNETVVRQLANLSIPVIVGIGHEQDEPLASIAADKRVSTPTACAECLNKPWQMLTQKIQRLQNKLLQKQENQLNKTNRQVQALTNALESHMRTTLTSFRKVVRTLKSELKSIGHEIKTKKNILSRLANNLLTSYERDLDSVRTRLDGIEDRLKRVDPQRRLQQGYSIIYGKDGVVSSIEDTTNGEEVNVQVSDGTINAHVNNTQKDNEQE